MAIGVDRFRTRPQALGLTPAQDYLMFALAGDARLRRPDTELTALGTRGLHALSAGLIRTWHWTCGLLHTAADVDAAVGPPGRTWPAVADPAAEPGHGAGLLPSTR